MVPYPRTKTSYTNWLCDTFSFYLLNWVSQLQYGTKFNSLTIVVIVSVFLTKSEFYLNSYGKKSEWEKIFTKTAKINGGSINKTTHILSVKWKAKTKIYLEKGFKNDKSIHFIFIYFLKMIFIFPNVGLYS